MNKVLSVIFFVILAYILVGTAQHSNSLFFVFASNNSGYQIIRIILAFILGCQALTNPPRNRLLRVLTESISVVTAFWAISSVLYGTMMPMDFLAFIGSSIAVGISSIKEELPAVQRTEHLIRKRWLKKGGNMSEHTQQVKEVTNYGNGTKTKSTSIVDNDDERSINNSRTIAYQVIWFVAGVLIVLLAFRFVLILLGANPANGFTNFIYNISYPFARPFFGIFSYSIHYGISRVELSTLVAMAVYALIALALSRLVTIGARNSTRQV